jgi:hypothetical protein
VPEDEPDEAVVPVLFELAAGAALAVAALFFFGLAVGAVCATAIEPAARNAPTQKLAANFKYRFIVDLSGNFFSTASSTPTPTRLVDTTSAPPAAPACGLSPAVIQTKYSSLLRQI